jgi:glutathione S-transferase
LVVDNLQLCNFHTVLVRITYFLWLWLVKTLLSLKLYFLFESCSWWRSSVEPTLINHLRKHRYINGNEFTLTDIYLGFSLFHAKKFKLFDHNRIIKDYYQRLSNRLAFECAFQLLWNKINNFIIKRKFS